MKIDHEKMTAEIDLMENATYYVVDGIPKKVDDLPAGFGSQTIAWQHGKPVGFDIHLHKEKQMTQEVLYSFIPFKRIFIQL